MLSRTLTLVLIAIATAAAGCVTTPAPEEVESASADMTLDGVLAPSTEEIPGDIQLSAATPARSVNYGGAFQYLFEVEENATGFVFELEWSPSSPASESLSMWVRPAGVGSVPPADPADFVTASPPIGQADGAGPLRLALGMDAFPEPGEYEVVIRAAAEPAGVAANQPFTLYLTSFEDMPFDDAFSALAAEDDEA